MSRPDEPTAGLSRAGEIVSAAVRDGGVPGAVAAVGRGPRTYAPPAAARFAATERRADGTPWNGVVHDENARLMSGVAASGRCC